MSSPKVVAQEVQHMFGTIAPGYDLTNTALSLGIHHWWKRLVARTIPRSAQEVLDLCTGTGDLLPLIGRRAKRVVGADFCLPMLQVARKRFGDKFALFQADALRLPFNAARFDALTVAFGVRNLESLDTGLQEMARVLKPDGTLVILEFGQPPNKIIRALYNWYSRWIMPIIGGLLTGNRAAYHYLPETAAAFPCGKQFEERLRANGFIPAKTSSLSFGIAHLYEARKR